MTLPAWRTDSTSASSDWLPLMRLDPTAKSPRVSRSRNSTSYTITRAPPRVRKSMTPECTTRGQGQRPNVPSSAFSDESLISTIAMLDF